MREEGEHRWVSVREGGEAWGSGEGEHVRSGVWECEKREQ